MSNEEKNKANLLLSIIAGDLRCVAKMNSNVDEEYSEYWQKDMSVPPYHLRIDWSVPEFLHPKTEYFHGLPDLKMYPVWYYTDCL